ncbi:hypothetical protein SETIT_7G119500v2 [Setaria italica]|uniref:Uncharacterized protein n=2 Tax=Setaria TaxID=4554 RepID=A0A368RUK2_SETIT|nr:hypothetical protein SETIT_7G119500v2 [Setaria italica]TKW04723.1 hypothetical protein SEVIR_7G127650v2 [Setaria viridis]
MHHNPLFSDNRLGTGKFRAAKLNWLGFSDGCANQAARSCM